MPSHPKKTKGAKRGQAKALRDGESEIVKASEEMELGVEGCLSIPGLVGEVERHAAIQIKGLNRRGQPMKVKADGWLARIFQHEIDHVNGVVFPDRATRVWKPEPDEEENLA